MYTSCFLCQGTTRQKTWNLWSFPALDLGVASSPMVSSTAAHTSSSVICGLAAGWLGWWFSRWQASLCQYWTHVPLSRHTALFKGPTFCWDTREMQWPMAAVQDPMAQVEILTLGYMPAFSLMEYILLKFSFPILMMICNLILPDGFFPQDRRVHSVLWEMIFLDPRDRRWGWYPE